MKHIITVAVLLLCINNLAAQQNEEKVEPNRVIKILNAMSEEGDSLQQDSIVIPTIPVQSPTARSTENNANEDKEEAEAVKGTKKEKRVQKAEEAKKAKELLRAKKEKEAEEAKKAKELIRAQKEKEAEEAKEAKELIRLQEAKEAEEAKKAKELIRAKKEKEAEEAKKTKELIRAQKEKEAEEEKEAKELIRLQEAKEAEEAKKAKELIRAQKEKEAEEAKKAKELIRAQKEKEAEEAEEAKELIRLQEAKEAEEAKKAKELIRLQEAKEAEEAKRTKELIRLQEAKEFAALQGNTFYVDGQVRARGEYNHGAITPRELNDDAAIFFNERARITMGYERQNLQLRASVQHTGVWGQDAMNERSGRVAMNEAWAKGYTNNGLFLQVGRQVLSYDDERILGASDWNVAGNSHDALRMGYESAEHTVHIFGALNQTAENDRVGNYIGPMPYKNMAGLWYHYQARSFPLGISVLGMNIGVERTRLGDPTGDVKYTQIAGTHITYKVSDFDFAASFYFETGTEAMSRKDISAYMASGRAAYNGDIVGGFLGYDYLSGNNGRNTNQHAFNPLYGTNHKFYGAMDYFTSTVNCGLQDPHGGIFVNLGRKRADVGRPVTISGTYHYFLTGEKFGDYEWTIGHEADFQVTARLLRDFSITAGYSFMLGTKTFELIKGGNSDIWQDWGYLTFSFTPRLFKLNW